MLPAAFHASCCVPCVHVHLLSQIHPSLVNLQVSAHDVEHALEALADVADSTGSTNNDRRGAASGAALPAGSSGSVVAGKSTTLSLGDLKKAVDAALAAVLGCVASASAAKGSLLDGVSAWATNAASGSSVSVSHEPATVIEMSKHRVRVRRLGVVAPLSCERDAGRFVCHCCCCFVQLMSAADTGKASVASRGGDAEPHPEGCASRRLVAQLSAAVAALDTSVKAMQPNVDHIPAMREQLQKVLERNLSRQLDLPEVRRLWPVFFTPSPFPSCLCQLASELALVGSRATLDGRVSQLEHDVVKLYDSVVRALHWPQRDAVVLSRRAV